MPDTVYWMAPMGWYHLVAFSLLAPLLAFRSRQRLLRGGGPPISRDRYYRSSATILILFGALSLLTAWSQDMDIFPRQILRPWISVPAAVGMYGLAVAGMRPWWRRAVEQRATFVRVFMPVTAADRRWWVMLSILAGVSEEITWRGVQPPLVAYLTGLPMAGAIVAAAAFGAAHAMQGWKSATAIVGFALMFQGLVWVSGSLYLAMAVHAAYDVTAGLAYARLIREADARIPDPVAP